MLEHKADPQVARLEKIIRNIRAEYDEESIIRKDWIINSRKAQSLDDFRFVQIGFAFLIESAILKDTSYYPGILGIGRSIAIGEERYLVDMLLRNISRKERRTSLCSQVISQTLGTVNSSASPSAVFIPLAFHNALHMNAFPGVSVSYKRDVRASRGRLCYGSIREEAAPLIFWSSKYISFPGLIFVYREFGEWIVKMSNGQWLSVDVAPADELKKLRVSVKTIACLHVLNPEAGLLLDVPTPRD